MNTKQPAHNRKTVKVLNKRSVALLLAAVVIMGGMIWFLADRRGGNGNSNPAHFAGAVQSADFFPLTRTLFSGDKGWGMTLKGNLAYTEDGTKHWTEVIPPLQHADRFVSAYFSLDEKTCWYYSSREDYVYKTADKGKTWIKAYLPIKMSVGTDKITPQSTIALTFSNKRNGWLTHWGDAGHEAELVRTTDGGVTWKKVNIIKPDWVDGDNFPNQVAFMDSEVGYTLGTGKEDPNSKLMRTDDGGKTWNAVDVAPSIGHESSSMSISLPRFFSNKGGVMAVRYSDNQSPMVNELYETSDGGASWQLKSELPATIFMDTPLFFDEKIGYCWTSKMPGSSTRLWKTADGGTTWEEISIDHSLTVNAGLSIATSTTWFITPAKLELGGYSYQVFETVDGGINWSSLGEGK